MTASAVEYEKDGVLAMLWLNRPERRNTFDLAMLRALRDGLARADADADVRAIIIRGRGDAFCAGADPSLLGAGGSWIELSRTVARTFDAIAGARKVTIAAVHGYAVAGGFE